MYTLHVAVYTKSDQVVKFVRASLRKIHNVMRVKWASAAAVTTLPPVSSIARFSVSGRHLYPAVELRLGVTRALT